MNSSSTKSLPRRSSRILPLLHFFRAMLVFVLLSLFTAIHSELGNEISAGESSGFAWISANIIKLLWTGLAYLVFVLWLQLRQNRLTSVYFTRMMMVLVFVDPTRNRVLDYVLLDTDFEYFLGNFLPPILSGLTSLWFGILVVCEQLFSFSSRNFSTLRRQWAVIWKG